MNGCGLEIAMEDGCVMGAVVDSPEHRKDVARFCAETVKGGGTLERVTCAAVREMPWNCSAHSSPAEPD